MAHAQGAPDDFPSLTLAYQDSNGDGTATLTNQGADAASDGVALAVTITQNGVTFQGAGVARQTAPETFLLAGFVADPQGTASFLVGKLVRGGDGWSGQGRLQGIQDPAVTDQWTMAASFPVPPPPRPTVTGGPPPPPPPRPTVTGGPPPPPTPPSPPPTVTGGPSPVVRTLTEADHGQRIVLHVGDRVRLALSSSFDWQVTVDDPAVVGQVAGIPAMGGTQGVFEARQPGQTQLRAIGDPPCRKVQPPCAAPSWFFHVLLVVA